MRVAVFGRNPKMMLLRLALWAALCLVVFKVLFLHIRVDGISMLPTCADRSTYWVSRIAYLRHEPQRGDVVAIRFVAPDNSIRRLEPPHIVLLKRIIGLPGETVAFVNGHVLINGELLDEPYEKSRYNWNSAPVTLGPNQYYVVGDNRSMPAGDHVHGVFERTQIVGKALL